MTVLDWFNGSSINKNPLDLKYRLCCYCEESCWSWGCRIKSQGCVLALETGYGQWELGSLLFPSGLGWAGRRWSSTNFHMAGHHLWFFCEMLSADRGTGIATGMLTFTAGSALCYRGIQGTGGTVGTLCVFLRGLWASAHSCLLVLGSRTARWEDRDTTFQGI